MPPGEDEQGEVVFRGPRILVIRDNTVLYVSSRERVPEEVKRLTIEQGHIIEEPAVQQREVYSRILLCGSARPALNGKLLVQFISEYRKTPRELLLQAFGVAVAQGAPGRIVPVSYDVDCVAQHFPDNIWDENFHRQGRVQRGRITGRQVDRDPAATDLRQGKTFVGVEIPIQNSIQKMRVYQRGSITFMGLKSPDFHTAATERVAIEKILLVIERLNPCEA